MVLATQILHLMLTNLTSPLWKLWLRPCVLFRNRFLYHFSLFFQLSCSELCSSIKLNFFCNGNYSYLYVAHEIKISFKYYFILFHVNSRWKPRLSNWASQWKMNFNWNPNKQAQEAIVRKNKFVPSKCVL